MSSTIHAQPTATKRRSLRAWAGQSSVFAAASRWSSVATTGVSCPLIESGGFHVSKAAAHHPDKAVLSKTALASPHVSATRNDSPLHHMAGLPQGDRAQYGDGARRCRKPLFSRFCREIGSRKERKNALSAAQPLLGCVEPLPDLEGGFLQWRQRSHHLSSSSSLR